MPIAAFVISLLLWRMKRRGALLSKPWPLKAKGHLLSKRERALYRPADAWSTSWNHWVALTGVGQRSTCNGWCR